MNNLKLVARAIFVLAAAHIEEAFIVFTALAALLHSTTVWRAFSGDDTSALSVVFAFLMALALDIGQIVTAYLIRRGYRHWMMYVLFGSISLMTFYLQLLYAITHLPMLPIAAGVRDDWRYAAQLFLDARLFVLPLVLPATTFLYTFAFRPKAKPVPRAVPGRSMPVPDGTEQVRITKPTRNELPAGPAPIEIAKEWLSSHPDHGLSIGKAAQEAGVSKTTMSRAMDRSRPDA